MSKVICESSFLNSLFQCSLCNELIHAATVISECLHRFCKLCITNYFSKNDDNKTCPVCQIILIDPLQTLKSDLIYQRLLYKIFHREITCKSSHKSTSIQIDTIIHVYLEHWNNSFSIELSKCYLECLANTSLTSIEKFLRIKYSIPSIFKIDLFYKSILLNINHECLIDLYYCFDIINQVKNAPLNIRFIVSRPYDYKSLRKHNQQSIPLKIEITSPINSSSLLSSSTTTNSIDSKLKVKIYRSKTSTNDWFIPQSTLPVLINSYKKQKKKLKLPRKQRRIRFIPTMVEIPPSIFDYLSNDINKQKTICQISSYISDNSIPLDLSLKLN